MRQTIHAQQREIVKAQEHLSVCTEQVITGSSSKSDWCACVASIVWSCLSPPVVFLEFVPAALENRSYTMRIGLTPGLWRAHGHELGTMVTIEDRVVEQLLVAERREKAQREHFEGVGKDNQTTIKHLTDDLRFLIKKREEDYLNLLQQNKVNEEAWKRDNRLLSEQLQTMRSDVAVQIGVIAKRLGKARITAQFLKPGTPGGKHALGERKPGVHVQRASIVPGERGGGGGSTRVDGVSKEDLDDLRTDLEEQASVAAALQTLMDHNKNLQANVEEWQDKWIKANALANQVALALQGQANRNSASAGQVRLLCYVCCHCLKCCTYKPYSWLMDNDLSMTWGVTTMTVMGRSGQRCSRKSSNP